MLSEREHPHMSSDTPPAPEFLPPDEPVELIVDELDAGTRLDRYLAIKFPAYSRVHLRRVINALGVTVSGERAKASHPLKAGEVVRIQLPDLPRQGPEPEAIPLEILYEDEHLAAVNKPPGMVVHPAKGHWSGTLTAALAYHFQHLSAVGGPTRPGIVHRLDRDTSGVILVAKTDYAHMRLAAQFESRDVQKAYFTLTAGAPHLDRDVIDAPIGAHPYQREKMAIRHNDETSRPATTFYEVLERFDGFAALRMEPKTGRTHQIRVHLTTLRTPVLCDRLYGSRAKLTVGELKRNPADETVLLERQALHAWQLKLEHPVSGQPLELEAALPADIQGALTALREFRPLKK